MAYEVEELRNYYSKDCYTPESFANKTLEFYFDKKPPSFPINIFKMLRDLGVFYEFRELDKLEGAYSPEGEYSAAVLVNVKRPFARQRFTVAHEICHHLKDYDRQIICPLNKKDEIERFADRFASELLMPTEKFKEEADRLSDSRKKVDPDRAYDLCHFFGASYRAVIWKLYKYDYLTFIPNEKFFKKAKPQRILSKLPQNYFLEHIVNDYSYLPQESTSPLWYKFKNELVFHDNRLEGIKISQEDTAEILTDLRLFKEESIYYSEVKDKEACEVIGHSIIYDYLIDTEEYPDRYKLRYLCELLFCLAPYGDQMSTFRSSNNMITGSSIETVDYTLIESELYWVDKDIDHLIEKSEKLEVSDFLLKAIKIHHRITQIHPFNDGNGRTSRALLNWLLKIKNLPPVYVPYELKENYIEALAKGDDYDIQVLYEFFLYRLLSSFIELNDELSLAY